MERSKIGFVTGLAAEAQLLRDCGFLVGIGGGLPEGAYRAAEALVAQGAGALISFGLAGGLAPGIRPGAVLVPRTIIEGPRVYFCDASLMAFLGGATDQPITAGHRIAATVQDKTALFRRTKAAAVDLESGAVARVASARKLPFAVLRAIADPADRRLPPAAMIPLKPGGGIDLWRILASVAAHPGQITGLIGLAGDAGKARAALVARVKQLNA